MGEKLELSEELLRVAISSKITVRAFREYDKIHQNIFFNAKKDISASQYDILMKIINRDGRFNEYLDGFLADHISWDMEKHLQTKDYNLDIGSVIFLETLLRDEDDDPYLAEPLQFQCMLDPSSESVKTITRRGAKSFTDRVVSFRDCVDMPRIGVLVTEQSWTVSKKWLEDIFLWFENSSLIYDWSGGHLRKDSETNIEFGNRSFIICYTASNLSNIRGLGVRRIVNDEKSLYTTDTAVSRVVARGQKKKVGKERMTIRISGTPLGTGTSFHKDQLAPQKLQQFAPIICPMGYKKPLCYDCDYYTLTQYRKGISPSFVKLECTAPMNIKDNGLPDWTNCWKRIPDDRFTFEELEEDWIALGKTLWMQEYMCATQDYSGNAISLELINAITDDNLEAIYESKLPCFVGVDFGLTDKHNSAISIVGKLEDGRVQNLQTIVFPPGNPYKTRVGSEDKRIGILDAVVNLFKPYPNIVKIIADASGVGKPLVEHDLVDMCRHASGFSNVIPYKIVGESKEFMGKSQLFFSLIKPAMEVGQFKTYMDRRLYSEMRSWQVEYDPTQQKRPSLHPPKIGAVQTDDALISLFLALWGALTESFGSARETVAIGGIKDETYTPFLGAFGNG